MNTLGQGNWATIEVNFPEKVGEVGIRRNQDMYMSYDSKGGTSQEVVFFQGMLVSNGVDDCSSQCTIPVTPGKNNIRIQPNLTHMIIRVIS